MIASPHGPGIVKNDSTTPWEWAISYKLSAPDFNKVTALVDTSISNPPPWNAIKFNCVSWVAHVAGVAGITLPKHDGFGWDYPADFENELISIGEGNTYAGKVSDKYSGKILKYTANATGAALDSSNRPIDYDWHAIAEQAGVAPSSLASQLGLPTDLSDGGNYGISLTDSWNVSLAGLTTPDLDNAIVSINWGDGSAIDVQQTAFSHQYLNSGDYLVSVSLVDTGAVHWTQLHAHVTGNGSTQDAIVDFDRAAYPPLPEVPNEFSADYNNVYSPRYEAIPEPTSWLLLVLAAIVGLACRTPH